MPGTLRTTLFQQYLRLQMWLLSRIIWYLAWIYIGSFVLFALVRIFTGVSIKRLGYFSLRHISIHPKQGIEIRIGKFGISPHRPTVARPGFVTFVVSNLEVIVDPEVIIEQEELQTRQQHAAEQTEELKSTPLDNPEASIPNSRRPSKDSISEDLPKTKMFHGIPLLPKKNARVFQAMRWLVTTMRVFDINVQSVSLVFADVITTVMTAANLRIDLRKTLNYKRSNFVGTLDSYKLADNELPFSIKLGIIDIYTAENLEDESPWQVVEDLRLDISGVLNLETMAAKEMGVQIHSGRLELDVKYILETLGKIMKIRANSVEHLNEAAVPASPSFATSDASSAANTPAATSRTTTPRPPEQRGSSESPSESSTSSSESKTSRGALFGSKDKKRMMDAAELVIHLINRIQITIGVLESVRIPILHHRHLDGKTSDEEETVMMALGMKDLNVDISRMNSKASGFRLIYEENDLAHQLLFMLASLNVAFDNGDRQEEVLYLPMITGLNRGNVISQTLKYIRSKDPNKVNKAHWRSRWATNAPTISIEEHQLPDMVRVVLGLMNKKKERAASPATFSPASSGISTPEGSAAASGRSTPSNSETGNSRLQTPLSSYETSSGSDIDSDKNDLPTERKGDQNRTTYQNNHPELETSDITTVIDPAREFLQHALPNLDLEIVFTDVSSRLRCNDAKHCSNAMFITSADSIFMSIKGEHCKKEVEQVHADGRRNTHVPGKVVLGYAAKAKFITAGAKVWYHSSNLSRFDLASTREFQLTVTAATTPTLSVQIDGSQNKFHVNLLRHEIFSSMAQIHASIRKPILQWRAHHKGQRVAHQDTAPVYKGSALRGIPKFLTSVKLSFSDFSVALASNHFRGKTNDVLGVKFVTRDLVVAYSTKDRSLPSEHKCIAPTDGRHFNVKGNNFVLYKADHELLEETMRHSVEALTVDEGLLEQHAVAQLPELGVDIWTHSASHTSIDVCIEPRLKIVLNINLILAFSVLRENINEVLLRHTRSSSSKHQAAAMPVPTDTEEIKNHTSHADTLADSTEATPVTPNSAELAVPSNLAVEQNHIKVTLPRALIKIDMPSDDQLMVELNKSSISICHGKNPIFHAKGMKMYSKHPLQHEFWCILNSWVGIRAEVNRVSPEIPDKIILDVDGLRINVPFKFKLYRIIDNGITLAKAIKTLLLQTDKLDTMLVLDPKRIEDIPNIPRVRLRTSHFLLSLEDDYFESDLTLLMLTQLEVADTRRRKLYLFDSRVKKMLRLGLKLLDEGFLMQADPESNHHGHHHYFPGSFDIGDVGSRLSHIDDRVTDRVSHAASHFRRGAANVFEHKHNDRPRSNHQRSSSMSQSQNGSSNDRSDSEEPRESLESYMRHLAMSLQHIPRVEIEALLHEGLELGCPADDNDTAYMKKHAWLNFWSSKTFARFRGLKMILKDSLPAKFSVDEARIALLEDFSRMWVDTMRHARMTQHYGVQRKLREKVHDQFDPDTCAEEKIVDYSLKPLLMAADFRDMDLTIARTQYGTSKQLHKFLHDIGKGQPMDSEFSILVPLYIDMKARDGSRVDLKDFPLPVVHFPGLERSQDPSTNLALRIKGDLVITEQLMHTDKNIRKLYVPLKTLPKDLRKTRGSDVLEVHRTLTPIKTFTNLKFDSGSSLPTRVCWCMAYKPGFHGVGEAFSGFSKPPIDPSPSLGFWDKIRLILHARFEFSFPKSALCLAMKAGKSPYSLLNSNSGFVFVWRDNTLVRINPDDNPKDLMSFESDKFELLVPNYMSWEAEFLNASPAERSFPRSVPLRKPENADKVVFSFNQRTIWQLGMKFEKSRKEAFIDPKTSKQSFMEIRDANFRPHYDVTMSMPEYIDDIEKYDAYKGFRSDFIYMSISVRSRFPEKLRDLDNSDNPTDDISHANKNAAHLTMGVIQHFTMWKNQFNSEQWPPIKTGSLFPDPVRVRPSTKTFGTALSTSSYQIVLSTLDLSFFQMLANHKGLGSHERTTGVKAKIEEFAFDWHTRREPPISENDNGDETSVELNGQRRWRMRSYLGEVRLKAVHLRAMDARFRTQSSSQALHALHEDDDDSDGVFTDEDTAASDSDSQSYYNPSVSQSGSKVGSSGPFGVSDHHPYGPRYLGTDHWIDLDDFTEVGVHRVLRSRTPDVQILPFIYTPEFSFIRHTDFTEKSVYVDSRTGDRFPKFAEVDVQTYHVETEQPGNVQARLLETRAGHLKERLDDLKASYESLEGLSSPSAAQKQRMKEILGLLTVGQQNQDVLKRTIDKYLDLAVKEDKRLADVKKSLRADLDQSLSLLKQGSHSEKAIDNMSESLDAYAQEIPSDCDFSVFRNRYVIHAMHLKWNNSVRNLIYRLQYALEENKELKYVRCRPAVEYLEELVSKAEKMANERQRMDDDELAKSPDDHRRNGETFGQNNPVTRLDSNNSVCDMAKLNKLNTKESTDEKIKRNKNVHEGNAEAGEAAASGNEDEDGGKARKLPTGDAGPRVSCDARLKNLFSDLKNVTDSEIARNAHFIYLPTPRIQLISEENPSKCLQIIAHNIEIQAVDTYSKNSNIDLDSSKIERRFGALLDQAGFYVLGESDVDQPGVEALSLERYSGEEEDNNKLWPPWLAVELCYNPEPMRHFQVVRDVSFGITMHKPNDLHVADNNEDYPISEEKDEKALDILQGKADEEDDKKLKDEALKAHDSKSYDETKTQRDSETSANSSEKHDSQRPANKSTSSHRDKRESVAGIPENLHKTLRHHGEHKGKAILTSVMVDAPQLVIEVDSVQFYTIYTIAVDLLTYRDPLIKKREQAINRVFLINDFEGDYRSSLNNIELLQKDIRVLFNLNERLLIYSARLQEEDHSAQVHLVKLRREVLRRQTRLIVLIRAFKASLRRNMNTGVDKLTKWSLLADAIDMRLLNEVGKPMMEVLLRYAHFSKLSNDDEGSVNRATLSGLSVRNLLTGAVYPQMLANYEMENSKFNGERDAIKLKWTRLERVGGIPVLDNAEVQLKPMHIQIEHGLFQKLLDFAFPITDNNGNGNGGNGQKQSDSPRKSYDNGGANRVDSHDEDLDDVFSSSDSDSDISVTFSELELEGSEEKVKEKKRELRQQQKDTKKKRGLFQKLVHHGSSQDDSRRNADLDEMLDRASSFWSIRYLNILPTELVVSYKGKSHSVLNIQNLHVHFPGLEIVNKTLTKLDLIMRVKKMGIKILLSQSGSIIGNMLKRHKRHAIEDERDLSFNSLGHKLVAASTSTMRKREIQEKERLAELNKDNHLNYREVDLIKEAEMILIPYHRRLAIENPGMAKEVAREATMKPQDLSKLQRVQSLSGSSTKSNSLASRSTSGRNTSLSSSMSATTVGSSSNTSSYQHTTNMMRHPSTGAQQRAPGSPRHMRQSSYQQQLQQQQQQQAKQPSGPPAPPSPPPPSQHHQPLHNFLHHQNSKKESDSDAQSTSSTSSKPAKIFNKIRRGFS